MTYSKLRLKKNEDRRIKAGHLWIYSNEIDTVTSPLNSFEPGQLITVENQHQQSLGIGYINPHSLICTRLLSHDVNTIIDEAFFKQRINTALSLRQKLFTHPYYRLVYGESDGLPGIVIDRYGDILVMQITTAGMELLLPIITDALISIIHPQAILLRNDSQMRVMENIPEIIKPVYGEPPQQVELIENEIQFQTNIWEGQKTGWFYDHRLNRQYMTHFVKNKRVLDVFSYVGAWAIQAASSGASEVYAIDSSAFALSQLKQNAQLNNMLEKITVIQDDAFKALTNLKNAKEKFDIIILDPPAFIKKRKDSKEGLIAYKRLNDLALQLLAPDSILISASCSLHLSGEELVDILRSTSNQRNKQLQIIAQGHQGPDHPVHPAIAETNYLKAIFCRIC